MLAVALSLAAGPAGAAVVVAVSGNQATATIALSDGLNSYNADVTITFDSVYNLSPSELNLSAQLVDPSDSVLNLRLPGCLLVAPDCVTVDPAFPVMITVEPLNVPWLFQSGFEVDEANGNLSFINAYTFEVHTANLDCGISDPACAGSLYRLMKAPINGFFDDITSDVLAGSVRARGTGGSFSQFIVLKDARQTFLVESLVKQPELRTRILAASLNNPLQTTLLNLVDAVQAAADSGQYATAITNLDQLIVTIQAHSGVDIANSWSSDHSLVNDAGEMLSLANTLRFTLDRLNNGF